MKKKLFAVLFCVVLSTAVCACNKTDPTGSQTGTPTVVPTQVPQSTATPSVLETKIEEAYTNLPVTDYEEYVDSTVLPEGYIGFEVNEVTDADVEEYVKASLANYKERILKETPLEEGDIAIIDFTGYVDGKTFEGGSAQAYEFEVGNSGFIPGFDEGLVGAKKGDTLMLNLKFPEDYRSAKLAGKDVTFEVKIHSTAAQVLPEFTDDLVVEITSGQYTTTEEFRSYARGFLQEERRYNGIMDYLVGDAVFNKFNEEYIQAAFELEKMYYATMCGMESVEALEAAWETMYGPSYVEGMWGMVEEQIRRYEQDRVVLYCVAKAENLELTEDEFIQRVTEYAESLEMTYAELMAVEDEKALRQSMLMELAMEHLLENIVIVEKGEE
ncbi:MAG: FKBP-type peptidyl-prolyl cis-trans isomerase [Lachnospiraceae bacterium]|nr:FKBP-type peptidyl-prolyl cis-trans isomerase [Lachnospiraceae bacterium]